MPDTSGMSNLPHSCWSKVQETQKHHSALKLAIRLLLFLKMKHFEHRTYWNPAETGLEASNLWTGSPNTRGDM